MENPIAAGALALVAIVFVVALLAAVSSGLRGRRRRNAIRREPRLYGVSDDGDDDVPAYAEAPPDARPAARAPIPPRAPRRGFGLAALTIAFVLGLVAGMAAMLTSRQEIANGLAQLATLVAPESQGTAKTVTDSPPSAPVASPVPAATSPVRDVTPAASGPAEDVGARLADFAATLEASLPRPAGPDMALERVSVDGMTLNLDYGVTRVLPPEEVASFRAFIDRTVRSLFCAEEAREIRYLSQNGVVFHMTYADRTGASLSELTVTPTYCG